MTIADVLALPMPTPSHEQAHELAALARKMLALAPKLRVEAHESKRKTLQNAVEATDQQIDRLVHKLYGLTENEIALVEGRG